MAINTRAIVDAVRSHALATGQVERAAGHEPKNAPGAGLTIGVWAQHLRPVPRASGLAATGVRLALNVRVYTPMLAEPQDEIDPRVLDLVDALMAAYNGDFTLGGLVQSVDILGVHGIPLDAQAGYLRIGSTLYRVMTITLPVIIADAWEQAA